MFIINKEYNKSLLDRVFLNLDVLMQFCQGIKIIPFVFIWIINDNY